MDSSRNTEAESFGFSVIETYSSNMQVPDAERLKIDISHFRGIRSKKFSIPSHGLVKIKGSNGSGKSTLLNALSWCLFGFPGDTQDFTESRTRRDTCKVSVHLPGNLTTSGRAISVTRTDRPVTLKCKIAEYAPAPAVEGSCELQETAGVLTQSAKSRKRSRDSPKPEETPTKKRKGQSSSNLEANQEIIVRELTAKKFWLSFSFLTHTRSRGFFNLTATGKLEALTDICNGDDAPAELAESIESKIKSIQVDIAKNIGGHREIDNMFKRYLEMFVSRRPGIEVSGELSKVEDGSYLKSVKREAESLQQKMEVLTEMSSKRTHLSKSLSDLTTSRDETRRRVEEQLDLLKLQTKNLSYSMEELLPPEVVETLSSSDPTTFCAIGDSFLVAWMLRTCARRNFLSVQLENHTILTQRSKSLESKLESYGLLEEGDLDLDSSEVKERLRLLGCKQTLLCAKRDNKRLGILIQSLSLLECKVEERELNSTDASDFYQQKLMQKMDIKWMEESVAKSKGAVEFLKGKSLKLKGSMTLQESSMQTCIKQRGVLEAFETKIKADMKTCSTSLENLEQQIVVAAGFDLWDRCNKICPSC